MIESWNISDFKNSFISPANEDICEIWRSRQLRYIREETNHARVCPKWTCTYPQPTPRVFVIVRVCHNNVAQIAARHHYTKPDYNPNVTVITAAMSHHSLPVSVSSNLQPSLYPSFSLYTSSILSLPCSGLSLSVCLSTRAGLKSTSRGVCVGEDALQPAGLCIENEFLYFSRGQ